MDLPLPQAIETYVRAENAGNVEELSDCFAPYATVRADDEFYEGRAAIKAWKAANRNRNVTPLELQVWNSHATLKARLKGYFPGEESVAKLKFALVGDQIASLRIRS